MTILLNPKRYQRRTKKDKIRTKDQRDIAKRDQKRPKNNLRGTKEGTERDQRGTRGGPKKDQKGTKKGSKRDQKLRSVLACKSHKNIHFFKHEYLLLVVL